MVLSDELEEYVSKLPNTMSLKKKIIKFIMKSNSPLTQKDVKDGLKQKDWTNTRRVLNELVESGLVTKARIGVKDYYVKIGRRRNSEHMEYQDEHKNNIHIFIDHFEPDAKNGINEIRLKQSRRVDLDNYDILGKLSIPFNQVDNLIEKLTRLKKEVEQDERGEKRKNYEHKLS